MSAVLAPAVQRVRIERRGLAAYLPTVEAMREFTVGRDADTPDELWLLEHPPVYTLGLGADPAYGPRGDTGIPVLRVERGMVDRVVTRKELPKVLGSILRTLMMGRERRPAA